MNFKKISSNVTISVAAAIVSLAASLAVAQGTAAKAPDRAASGVADHGSEALSQSMMDDMKKMQGMKPRGDTDKDFAMMMKMHHQQALDMAQIEIEHGNSPEMKAMAKKIFAAQKKEIAEFDQWMSKHP